MKKSPEIIISLQKINKSFPLEIGGEQQVLFDIDFDVRAGEFVAIIGTSGSGKSTFLHICAGLDSCDAGRVMIRGEDIQAPELAQWLMEAAAAKGRKRMLDADGCADFSNLEQGLYLIAPEDSGETVFSPFLVQLPMAGSWEVLAKPKARELLTQSPKTGDHPAPVFSAMGLILSGMGLTVCVEKLRKNK